MRIKLTLEQWEQALRLVDKAKPDEISFFGEVDENLNLIQWHIPKQEITGASVEIDTGAMADLFADCVLRGNKASLLIHSHPGNMDRPSTIDESNWLDLIKYVDFLALVIITQESHKVWKRLDTKVSLAGHEEIVSGDLFLDFDFSMPEELLNQYKENVSKPLPRMIGNAKKDEKFYGSKKTQTKRAKDSGLCLACYEKAKLNKDGLCEDCEKYFTDSIVQDDAVSFDPFDFDAFSDFYRED